MERDEDEDGDEDGSSPLELAELMQRHLIRQGQKLEELRVTQRAYDQLEQECSPCTVEEYFEIPIYITGRN